MLWLTVITLIYKNTDYMDVMSYRTYRLSPFITFLAFKSGLAANNHIGLLIVPHIVNIFPFSFQTKFFYAFYALDRYRNCGDPKG